MITIFQFQMFDTLLIVSLLHLLLLLPLLPFYKYLERSNRRMADYSDAINCTDQSDLRQKELEERDNYLLGHLC